MTREESFKQRVDALVDLGVMPTAVAIHARAGATLDGKEAGWRKERLLELGFLKKGQRWLPPVPGTYVEAIREIQDQHGDGTPYLHAKPGDVGVILHYHHVLCPTILWDKDYTSALDTYGHPHSWAERCTGFGVYDCSLVKTIRPWRGHPSPGGAV